MSKIDFVVTWVDGNDPKWQKKKAQYNPRSSDGLNTAARYRDWQFLKYWFRSVEKNAPWVNKIFFVTEGHLPDWLDTSNEKLVVVKHSDYIDEQYLPTFNSNVIELNFHRIEGLSDCFVNFNDDVFLNRPVLPTDFFDGTIPRDTGVFSPIVPKRYTISSIVLNNVEVINEYFNSRQILKSHFFKFFNVKYGKHFIKNICVLPWRRILGFYDSHIAVSYNKKSFETLWEKENDLLTEVSSHKFREKTDVNHWLMRYWQLSSGGFKTRSINFGKYYGIEEDYTAILQDIEQSKHAIICLNDADEITDFKGKRDRLLQTFQQRYPEKSSFEK